MNVLGGNDMAFAKGKNFVKQNWKKILIWLLAALACLYCSVQVDHLSRFNLPWSTAQQFPHAGRWNPSPSIPGTVELKPGESLEQSFTAMGNIVGSCSELYLKVPPETENVRISAVLWSERKQTALMETEAEITEIPQDGQIAIRFPEPVTIKSHEDYRIILSNVGDKPLPLGIDRSVQSGVLSAKGEPLDGALTYGFLRTSMYTPSALLKCMILLTNVTVLLGLALVLFCDVKEHVLYFVLAVGFGIVTLFDLTPLYGFDMRFQFDSAYVVSNELLGLEGEIQMPSQADPGRNSAWYYRRACDDYSMFQFYKEETVSDNYTDMVAGIKDLRPEPEKQELILVETNQGYVSDQLYILYLPQALGFTAARLLGLGFLPMVQLGRIVPYMLFVMLMFFAIRAVPFGKRVFLILALLPVVLTDTVSINRDGIVFGLSFFLVAKTLQMAYASQKPKIWDWIVLFTVSALLAPCKAIYLPMSFFWLLVVYRQYVYGQKPSWGKTALCIAGGVLPIMLMMKFAASIDVFAMLSDIFESFLPAAAPAAPATAAVAAAAPAATEAVEAVESAAPAAASPGIYNFPYVVSNLPRVCTVFWNTLRVELGSYLVNAIQFYDMDIGSSETMTILILFLLMVECCHSEEPYLVIRRRDRYFGLLIAVGVFLATALAALQWTSVGSYTIFGLQGRYLIPALPLLCFFLMNNRLLKIQGSTQTMVKACCCIFPAIYLMNMYLWTISRG